MKKIIGIVTAVILVLLVAAYAYLGGFAKPEISVVEMKETTIYGREYDGNIQNKAFGALFSEMEELSKKYDGIVVAVYYNDPDKTNGKAKTFVGITTAVEITDSGIEKRVFEGRKVIKAVLNAKYMIAPVKIYSSIKEFAEKNNLVTTETAIETYPSDSQMTVEVFIK